MVMRENNQLLVLTHLSQLLNYVTGFGGLIAPLVIWLMQRDKIMYMDEQGKAIINFQISMFIYAILCIPLIFLFGLGIVALIAVGIVTLIFPIINAIKVSNRQEPGYPLSLTILK